MGSVYINTKIHVWHTGSVYIDRSLAFKEKTWHPMPYSGWLRKMANKSWFPVSVYLIEHPKGNVLIDTGWHEEIRLNSKKHLGWLSHSMFKGRLPHGESVKERLNNKKLSLKDLDYVILTHLHSDHVSGVKHVTEAKSILTSEVEWRAAQKGIGYVKNMWKGVSVKTFKFQDIPYGPFKKGYDLFGDGSVLLVFTPGHSKGQVSVLISTKKGWILLASDVGYAEKSWKDNILPGITVSKKDAYKSLMWIKEFSQRKDCRFVLANHDPEVNEGEIN